MKWNNYMFIVLGAVFLSSVSQILLKISANKKYEKKWREYINPYVMIGYFMFFGSTLLNVIALKYIPLALFPVLESSGYIFVTVLGRFILKEKINIKNGVGMLIIIVGILIFSINI